MATLSGASRTRTGDLLGAITPGTSFAGTYAACSSDVGRREFRQVLTVW